MLRYLEIIKNLFYTKKAKAEIQAEERHRMTQGYSSWDLPPGLRFDPFEGMGNPREIGLEELTKIRTPSKEVLERLERLRRPSGYHWRNHYVD